LDCVVEIIPPRPFTRLPGAGADVCGLVGVGGRVVTVFDLGVVLGLGRAADHADHRLLLWSSADAVWAPPWRTS
jgi:chemotaxis signal transduction protein